MIPDLQPMSPPEISDEEYDRNVRNNLRLEIIQIIGTLGDRLNELSDGGFDGTLWRLNKLREYLYGDYED